MKINILLILITLCAGCRYRELADPSPFIHEVSVGEKFRVTLPENHAQKENWNMLDDYNHNMVQRLGDVWHGDDKGLDVNLRCTAKGTTQLTFVKRIFGDTMEIRKFLVKCGEK
jgi:hypothetical protein